MTPDIPQPLDHTDLFVDSSHRVAAVAAAREFQKLGILPNTFAPQSPDVEKLHVVEPHVWYTIRYQAMDFGPTILAGVDTVGAVVQRKFTQMQATLYPQDETLISLTLIKSHHITDQSANKNSLSYIVQTFSKEGYHLTKMAFSHFITESMFAVTHETFTPFGIVRDVQFDSQMAILPELPNWPEYTISQAALRLLDEERMLKLFQLWPTGLSPNWGDMNTQETMAELSQRIIQQY